jgi:zinc transport system permease protein
LGVIVISSSSGFNAGLLGYLFGSLLSVSDSDILFIGLLAILTFLSVAFSSKHLAYIAFDEEGARAAGLPVNRLNMVLMLLVASSVVAGMRVVGILMVSSLLVVPGATAILIGKSFRMTLFLAVLFGVASVITGLTSAYYLNVAAGGAVVLAQVLFFLGVSVLSKRL